MFIFDMGGQCWCGNLQCAVLVWNAHLSLEELASDMGTLQFPPKEK